MKRIICALAVILVASLAATEAQARVFVGVGIGVPFGSYYPGYYYAPPPYYYAPAPVVYAPPVYAPPYVPPPPMLANQTSPTFVDAAGRTCRDYQSASGYGPVGTACVGPDGVWRTVAE